ncbi:uncharacterized protein LOC119126200 [Syngnathus acus]|uniref:uncharacterized protein LOC119126200 n=1 Tax=Syngnathus acus TaxID=161584 RepID=UPI00188612FB|nr:uncharacterized protein LOC119126200 [Syngnathus acus]
MSAMLSSFDVSCRISAPARTGVGRRVGVRRRPGVGVSALQGQWTTRFHSGSELHQRVHPVLSIHTGPSTSVDDSPDFWPAVTFHSALDGGSQRSGRSDRELTESESNHSYQNSHDEQESLAGDYIIVLPGDEAPAANPSGASTPSSGELHSYENVQSNTGYLNVNALPPEGETPTLSSQSDEDDDDDSDDSEGKYVNQASVMSSSPLHDGM